MSRSAKGFPDASRPITSGTSSSMDRSSRPPRNWSLRIAGYQKPQSISFALSVVLEGAASFIFCRISYSIRGRGGKLAVEGRCASAAAKGMRIFSGSTFVPHKIARRRYRRQPPVPAYCLWIRGQSPHNGSFGATLISSFCTSITPCPRAAGTPTGRSSFFRAESARLLG
jgi:hypothetical protein